MAIIKPLTEKRENVYWVEHLSRGLLTSPPTSPDADVDDVVAEGLSFAQNVSFNRVLNSLKKVPGYDRLNISNSTAGCIAHYNYAISENKTITVTNVSGKGRVTIESGGDFQTYTTAGDKIRYKHNGVDWSEWYTVASVDSATQLTLTTEVAHTGSDLTAWEMSTSVRGLYVFYDTIGNAWLLAACGAFLWYYDTDTATFNIVQNAGGGNRLFTPGLVTRFATMLGKCVVVNGMDPVTKVYTSGTVPVAEDLGGGAPTGAAYVMMAHEKCWLARFPTGESEIAWSATGDIEDWTTNNDAGSGYIGEDDGDVITGLAFLNEAVVVSKLLSIWNIYGKTAAEFTPYKSNSTHGALSQESIVQGPTGLFFCALDGLRHYNGNTSTLLSRDIYDSLLQQLSSGATYIPLSETKKVVAPTPPAYNGVKYISTSSVPYPAWGSIPSGAAWANPADYTAARTDDTSYIFKGYNPFELSLSKPDCGFPSGTSTRYDCSVDPEDAGWTFPPKNVNNYTVSGGSIFSDTSYNVSNKCYKDLIPNFGAGTSLYIKFKVFTESTATYCPYLRISFYGSSSLKYAAHLDIYRNGNVVQARLQQGYPVNFPDVGSWVTIGNLGQYIELFFMTSNYTVKLFNATLSELMSLPMTEQSSLPWYERILFGVHYQDFRGVSIPENPPPPQRIRYEIAELYYNNDWQNLGNIFSACKFDTSDLINLTSIVPKVICRARGRNGYRAQLYLWNNRTFTWDYKTTNQNENSGDISLEFTATEIPSYVSGGTVYALVSQGGLSPFQNNYLYLDYADLTVNYNEINTFFSVLCFPHKEQVVMVFLSEEGYGYIYDHTSVGEGNLSAFSAVKGYPFASWARTTGEGGEHPTYLGGVGLGHVYIFDPPTNTGNFAGEAIEFDARTHNLYCGSLFTKHFYHIYLKVKEMDATLRVRYWIDDGEETYYDIHLLGGKSRSTEYIVIPVKKFGKAIKIGLYNNEPGANIEVQGIGIGYRLPRVKMREFARGVVQT